MRASAHSLVQGVVYLLAPLPRVKNARTARRASLGERNVSLFLSFFLFGFFGDGRLAAKESARPLCFIGSLSFFGMGPPAILACSGWLVALFAGSFPQSIFFGSAWECAPC